MGDGRTADFMSRRADSEQRRMQEALRRGEMHDVASLERPAEDKHLPDQFAVWAPEFDARRTALAHAVETRTDGDGSDAIVTRAHAYLQFLKGTGGSGASSDPTD